MSTTLHLLLGNQHPHTLPSGYITRDHMLTLHNSLLTWLLTGRPPSLWEDNCLRPDISAPLSTKLGMSQPLISINAACALPHGRPWHPCRISIPTQALSSHTLLPQRPPKRRRPLHTTPLSISATPPPDNQQGASPPPPPETPLSESTTTAPSNMPHTHRTARGSALNRPELLKRMAAAL